MFIKSNYLSSWKFWNYRRYRMLKSNVLQWRRVIFYLCLIWRLEMLRLFNLNRVLLTLCCSLVLGKIFMNVMLIFYVILCQNMKLVLMVSRHFSGYDPDRGVSPKYRASSEGRKVPVCEPSWRHPLEPLPLRPKRDLSSLQGVLHSVRKCRLELSRR